MFLAAILVLNQEGLTWYDVRYVYFSPGHLEVVEHQL